MAHSSEISPSTVEPPGRRSARGWKRILLDAWKEAGKDNLALVSAGVAFYAFLAFVPLLTAFVLSYGLLAEPATVVAHVQTLTAIMPQDAASIIGDQLRSMTESSGTQTGFALLLALAIALYGASKGAGSIMTALNIVFEVGESRNFLARTLFSLVMTVGGVLVLILAILAVSALNFLEAALPDFGGVLRFLLQAGFFLAAAAGVMLLLALIYRYGPNRPRAKWKWITPGSAGATFIWLSATAGFGIYVSNFGNYNATYGSLGAVIVFLTWLYLSAYVVLLGAELNATLETEEKRRTALAPDFEPSEERDPGPSATAPSPARVVGRIGLFSLVLALLGTRRAEPGE